MYGISLIRARVCRPPLFDYDDCDGMKYFLQLNMYKYLLERFYDINVSSMHLVSLHPAQENYALINVPVSGH